MNKLKFAFARGIIYGCATIGTLFLTTQVFVDSGSILLSIIIFLICIGCIYYDCANY